MSLVRAFAVVFCLAAFGAGASDAPKVVRLSFETKANPPGYLGDGPTIDWKRPGLTVEMLRLVEPIANVRFEFVRMPWARSLYMLETNQIDGVFHGSFVEERLRFAAYPMRNGSPDAERSFFTQSYYFYARRDAKLQWDGKSLGPLSAPVGTTRSYSVIPYLKGLGAKVEEENDLPNSFRKVLAGRVAAYAELEYMAAAVLRAHPEEFRDIVKVGPPVRSTPYYLILSRGFASADPALAERIWDAIAAVKKTSEYQRLARSYESP